MSTATLSKRLDTLETRLSSADDGLKIIFRSFVAPDRDISKDVSGIELLGTGEELDRLPGESLEELHERACQHFRGGGIVRLAEVIG